MLKRRKTRRQRLSEALGRADQAGLRALRTRAGGPVLDRVTKGLGWFGEMGAGWVAIATAGAALDPANRRRWLAAAPVAPASVLINYAVKLAVGRERPLIEDHPPLARAPSKLSFPSAHSTSSVAAATVLSRVAPAATPAFAGLAAGVCISRPYLGMHYPSDVLAGVALGLTLGSTWPLPAEVRRPPGMPGREADDTAVRRPPGMPGREAEDTAVRRPPGMPGREAEDMPE